jgi:amino acid transporter
VPVKVKPRAPGPTRLAGHRPIKRSRGLPMIFRIGLLAVVVALGLGVLYVLFNDFRALAEQFVLGIWPFYALAVAAVFVLRRRRPDLPRPYQAWGYPVTPIIFLVASVGMVANALVTDTRNTMVTFGVVLAGIPAYWAWRRFGKQEVKSEK